MFQLEIHFLTPFGSVLKHVFVQSLQCGFVWRMTLCTCICTNYTFLFPQSGAGSSNTQ